MLCGTCEVRLPNGLSTEDLEALKRAEGAPIILKEYRRHGGMDNILDPEVGDLADVWHHAATGELGVVGQTTSNVLSVTVPKRGEIFSVRNTGPCSVFRGDMLCAFPAGWGPVLHLRSVGRSFRLPTVMPSDGADLYLERVVASAMYRFFGDRLPGGALPPGGPHGDESFRRCRYRGVTLAVPELLPSESYFARLLCRLGFLSVASNDVFAALLLGPGERRLEEPEAEELTRALMDSDGRVVPLPRDEADVTRALMRLPDVLAAARSLAEMTTCTPFGQVRDTVNGRMEIPPGEDCVVLKL